MTRERFRADVLAMLGCLDAAARAGYLPVYLAPGADVTRMARTVRVLGEVRRGPAAGEAGLDPRPGADGREEAQMYALPAERGQRAGAPQPWEQLAGEYQQLVVLADPGMGKSWLIRAETHRLALAAAGILADASTGVEDALIPVRVRADVLAAGRGRDLAEVISGYLVEERLLAARSAAQMRERVAAGGVVLLVDALDEVPREAAAAGGQAPGKRLQDLLRQWAAGCPGAARCVLTSRLAGYSGPPLPGMREAELLPFTLQDTRAAVQAWDLPVQAASRVDRLLGDPGVAGMARVPLLLALICSLAADSKHQGALPNTRTGLYEAVLWHFLSGSHRADDKSPVAALTPQEREGLLQILARAAFSFATTRQGWVDRMPHSELAAAIGGAGGGIPEQGAPSAEELVRRCVEAGVLVPAGNPSIAGQAYMFLHRTIAEYLTARHLRDLPSARRMQAVVDHQWFDPDWAEVIPMLGGLLATHDLAGAKALVTHFLSQWPDPLHRAFYTAIRILGDQPDPDHLLEPSQGHHLAQRAMGLFKQSVTSYHRRYVTYYDLRDTYYRLRDLLTAIPVWPRALLDALLSLLRDSGVRPAAARALAGHQDPAATQALIALLGDSDSNSGVRAAAADALAGHQDPAATQALIALLGDSDSNSGVRAAAARALAGHQDPAATQALIALLPDSNSDSGVRYAAADALAGHQDPAATQALIALLPDSNSDSDVRAAAARALAGHQDPAATQALIALLPDSNSDSDVRYAAAGALGDHQDPAATQALIALLRDSNSDSDVRPAAARALAGHQDPAATQALIALLRDSNSGVRYVAARALAGHQDPAITQALIALLRDSNSDVRSAAADALAGHQDPAATQALIALLRDSNSGVRSAAADALAGHQDPAATQALIALLPDSNMRYAAVGALADHQDPAATQALITLLSDSIYSMRCAAARALADHQDPAATQALIALLRDSDSDVRSAAARALAGRSEPQLLKWVSKQGILPQRKARRAALFELADQIADRDYLRLPPRDRPRIRRRLGKLTRKAVPVPGQRRFTAASRLHALTRQAKVRLRRQPLIAAAAFAAAVIAGVVGGKLTGKLTPALAAAFVVLLVAGMLLTALTQGGADTADTKDAHRQPR